MPGMTAEEVYANRFARAVVIENHNFYSPNTTMTQKEFDDEIQFWAKTVGIGAYRANNSIDTPTPEGMVVP